MIMLIKYGHKIEKFKQIIADKREEAKENIIKDSGYKGYEIKELIDALFFEIEELKKKIYQLESK